MYTVYMHTCPNGKVYIGITNRNPLSRWNNGNGYKNNAHFFNAIQKYGWGNITHEILYDGLSEYEACEAEKRLIEKYDSSNPTKGYNNTLGGEHGKFSEESKKRMSATHKGLQAGEKHPLYGKHFSEESRQKMRDSAIRRFQNAEERTKQSERRKGVTPWNKGIKYSDERREKISVSHKGLPAHNRKRVLCVETGVIYVSTYEAAQAVKKSQSSISEAAKGKRKTAGGYHWKYYEEV